MFREQIQAVVDKIDGGVAGILMGFDGISVDAYTKAGAVADIQTIGMELAHVIGQLRRAVETMNTGKLRETTVRADGLTVLVAPLNDEYFIALAVEPQGNFGKARYLLRLLAPQLLRDL